MINKRKLQEARQELLERCYECRGYGDDYIINDDGELESACADCYVQHGLNYIDMIEEENT